MTEILSLTDFKNWLKTGPLPRDVLFETYGMRDYRATGGWPDVGASAEIFRARDAVSGTFSFAVPCAEVIERISKTPLIEIGAGTGYWSALVRRAGGDILASDVAEGVSGYRQSIGAFVPIETVDAEKFVERHPARDVLCVWPTHGGDWLFRAAQAMQPGRTLFYIGEDYGGCTADDAFFDYVEEAFEQIEFVEMPVWYGLHDHLWVFLKK